MGDQAKKIVSMDVKKLINELNKALSDEWLATYQYWVGSKIVEGPFSSVIIKELEEHSKEEYEHAEIISTRIIQLGGTPIIDPRDWFKHSTCGYIRPKNFDQISILKDNIKGERCAIGVYNNLLNELKGKDHITFHLIEKILEEEVEHEEDLQNILEDIQKK